MARYIDLTGKKFTRLTVICFAGCKNEEAHWNCICDCGKQTCSSGKALRNGRAKSCGCYKKDLQRQLKTKHGHDARQKRTRCYTIWSNMKDRCQNPNNRYYANYGGRGITVCDRWQIFENFLSDMGEPSSNYSLERIDNNKGYSPHNCKWATRYDQMRNRTNNVVIEFNGKKQTLADWAIETGIPRNTLEYRLKHWDIEKAFNTPVKSSRLGK